MSRRCRGEPGSEPPLRQKMSTRIGPDRRRGRRRWRERPSSRRHRPGIKEFDPGVAGHDGKPAMATVATRARRGSAPPSVIPGCGQPPDPILSPRARSGQSPHRSPGASATAIRWTNGGRTGHRLPIARRGRVPSTQTDSCRDPALMRVRRGGRGGFAPRARRPRRSGGPGRRGRGRSPHSPARASAPAPHPVRRRRPPRRRPS